MKRTDMLVFSAAIMIISCTDRRNPGIGTFHADQQRTGIYASTDNKKLGGLRWNYKTDGKIFSSPVVIDEILFIGSEDGYFYALGAGDGNLIWKFSTGAAVSSTPAVQNGVVYFTSYNGYCYALDAHSGQEKWKFKTGGEKKVGAKGLWTMKPADLYMDDLWDFFLSSPVIGAGENPMLYVGSSDSSFYALDATTGKLKWKFKTGGIIHTSPSLDEGTVFFGSWDTWFYALDAMSGNLKWKFKTGEQPEYHVLEGIQASPTIKNGVVYFGARDGFFYALKESNGDSLWKFSADNSWVITTAAIDDSAIYIGTSDTYLFLALDLKTGVKKYSVKAKGYLYSSPAISGNMVYFGDFTGNFYALDLQSEGKSIDVFSTPARKVFAKQILNPRGELDFGFAMGKLDPALYSTSVEVMNRFYTLGSIVSSPAISGSTVYFGSTDSSVYAVSLVK